MYTCPVHEAEQDDFCERCVSDFSQRRDASAMTGDERAVELERMCRVVTMPFANIHQRVEELVGRPVWTHEMGGEENFKKLVEEARTQRHISFGEVVDKLPSGKPIIAIVADEEARP